jgi:hypothetical protein
VHSIRRTPFENLIVDFTDVDIYWCLSAPSWDGWKPSYLKLKSPGRDQMPVKGDHPSVQNTCVIGLGNGPAFIAEIVQLVARSLGVTWKLHMAYRPQNSEKIEYMNKTLKLQLGKLYQETHLQWD